MSNGNYKKSWHMEVGLNHVPAYQVSGVPYASGSIDARVGDSAVEISFPHVTRWVEIINNDVTASCKVGFSANGIAAKQYFTVGEAPAANQPNNSGRLELKVSKLFLTGSKNIDIVAGLTTIPASRTTTNFGPSWSGSSGVG